MPDLSRAHFATRFGAATVAGAAALAIAPAATFQVTTNSDSGPGSLRQALLDANANPGPDDVEVLATGQISLTTGPLVVAGAVNVNGPGADMLAVDAGGLSRVLVVTAGPCTLTGLTLRQGRAASLQPGGGVLAQTDLTLRRCHVRDNQTALVPGVNADGGGVFVNGGRFVAEQCLFWNNFVPLGTGGAVRVNSVASAEFLNCTFSGNSATQGGAVSCGGAARFDFCTFADNQASSAGGAVWSPVGATPVANSILFRNAAPSGPNWLGGAASGGFNLVGVALGSSGWVGTDRAGLDPMLAPFAGGVYALLEGSPALDSANPASLVAEDQRGVARPQGLGRDVGAFELEFVNDPPVAHAGADQTVPSEGATTVVQLDGSASSDPNGDDLQYAWFENGLPLSTEVMPELALADGTHTLTLVVTDPYGASSQDTVLITVEPPLAGDHRKPRIRHVCAAPRLLWPVNGSMRNVWVNYTVRDNSDPNPQVWLTVESNQADGGLAPNDQPGDFQVLNKNKVSLRAERFGHRHRTYTVVIHARDRDGNEATRKVKVLVPKKRRH